MGQAKARGTFEERRRQAVERNNGHRETLADCGVKLQAMGYLKNGRINMAALLALERIETL